MKKLNEKIIKFPPPIKDYIDKIDKTNPYIKFIWSYEKGRWLIDWNFKEEMNSNQITGLITMLESYKHRLINNINYQIDKETHDGGYMDFKEE